MFVIYQLHGNPSIGNRYFSSTVELEAFLERLTAKAQWLRVTAKDSAWGIPE